MMTTSPPAPVGTNDQSSPNRSSRPAVGDQPCLFVPGRVAQVHQQRGVVKRQEPSGRVPGAPNVHGGLVACPQ